MYISEKQKGKEVEEKDFTKFVEVEGFGERLQNIKEPVLCLLNVTSQEVKIIDIKYGCDSNNTVDVLRYPAQAMFVNDDSLVFMGVNVGSKKLGMTYIYCRPTLIYYMKLGENNNASN